MDEHTKTSNSYIYGLFQSEHWKQLAKTLSSNASTKNSISQECLTKEDIGNHDIKNLSWEKVLSFLNSMYAFAWPEHNAKTCSSGSPGLNEWIFTTHIQGQIFAPVLLDYLEKKKKMKSTSFFSITEYALELIHFFKTHLELDARFIGDKELANKDILMKFAEQSYPNFVQRDLIFTLDKKLLSHKLEFQTSMHNRSTRGRNQEINHPAINAHIKDLLRSGVKAKSVHNKYKASYAMFLHWLHYNYVQFQSISPDDIPLSKVTEEHLLEFKQYLLRLATKGVYSKHTVSDRFYDIRSLMSNLYKLGWLSRDITLDITGIAYDKYLHRDLPSDTELQRFFQTIQRYSDDPVTELTAFGLMLCLGLRIHEVAGTRYKDVNLENKTISIFGKNEKSVILPLPEPLQEYFANLSGGHSQDSYVFGDNIQAFIRELRKRYKLYTFVSGWNYPGGPHLLRHVFISRLSDRADCPPQLLMYLARHDRPENTARYVHRSTSQLQNAVNKINY